MKRSVFVPATLLAVALAIPSTTVGAGPAMSVQGSATATLTVHTHVVRSCRISATPVDFGNYDALVANRNQPLDATGTVDVTCTKGTPARIELGPGQGRQVNPQSNSRYMASGLENLEYNLYQDSGRTRRWSRFLGQVKLAPTSGAASPQKLTVYGRVFAGQNPTPGDYDGVVTATVKF
jgi:spore coat protein U-like protein